ncbi:hypothetical protein C2R22_06975 [Salinigranum rubrum]|uniref:Uncharacterized protein n=1 Tax=Salinigranum rubrum TaxID=755307 RepID=A0A2I8VHM6_9EURY|nr:hypothetical protein C2R22_06975 [Salinigranum rubrum]
MFAVGIGLPVLLLASGRPSRRIDLPVGRGHTLTFSIRGTDPETRGSARPGGPTLRALLGLFALGVVWLGCAAVLDVLAHDMVRFETVAQLRQYVGGTFGDSSLATVVTAGLVGIYRYGELAVRLSAPVVAVVVWFLYGREGRLFGPMSRRLDTVQWKISDD